MTVTTFSIQVKSDERLTTEQKQKIFDALEGYANDAREELPTAEIGVFGPQL